MEKVVQAMVNTIDSREIAEMLEMDHYKILLKLEGTKDGKTKGIIQVLTDHEFVVSEYFILSSYKDSSGKENKCYLFTKMGCDLIANKFQGEKGILFSAKYVQRFAELKTNVAKSSNLLNQINELNYKLKLLEEQNAKINDIQAYMNDLTNNIPLYSTECKELQCLVRKIGVKTLGGYKSPAYNNSSLRAKVYRDIQHQLKREFGVERYESIKRCQLEIAKNIIEEYKAPTILVSQISLLNSQGILPEKAV